MQVEPGRHGSEPWTVLEGVAAGVDRHWLARGGAMPPVEQKAGLSSPWPPRRGGKRYGASTADPAPACADELRCAQPSVLPRQRSRNTASRCRTYRMMLVRLDPDRLWRAARRCRAIRSTRRCLRISRITAERTYRETRSSRVIAVPSAVGRSGLGERGGEGHLGSHRFRRARSPPGRVEGDPEGVPRPPEGSKRYLGPPPAGGGYARPRNLRRCKLFQRVSLRASNPI